jgi:hypothetical protein
LFLSFRADQQLLLHSSISILFFSFPEQLLLISFCSDGKGSKRHGGRGHGRRRSSLLAKTAATGNVRQGGEITAAQCLQEARAVGSVQLDLGSLAVRGRRHGPRLLGSRCG